LHDDEALIVESTIPTNCLYRSLILTNELYETTDWYPGVPNWLDTAGYPQGVVQGRGPAAKRNRFRPSRKSLSQRFAMYCRAIHRWSLLAQRQAQIRDRRLALEQRTLW
jgi:hypothetical protein